jgi:hypothetical protein
MRISKGIFCLVAIAVVAMSAPAYAQLTFDGNVYTKFLWGTDRLGSALYNFTAIPGEGLGDSGQGSQLELYIRAKFGSKVELRTTIQSRFIRNFWTNGGGFGPPFCSGLFGANSPDCISSEWDPRSNQYIKLRGVQMVLNPGYSWLDNAIIGENDLGQYDAFIIGRIRYIDRFNVGAIQLSGSASDRQFTWDLIRISLLRNLGPFFNTGQFQPQDGTWAFQPKFKISPMFDVGGLISYTRDIEVDATDFDNDDGRDIATRFGNTVGGIKAGIHPSSMFDVNAALYFSNSKADPILAGAGLNSTSGFSPVPLGSLNDTSYKVNVDINDPFQNGLSFNVEYFNIGEDYVSLWAARRESDVLLTEGFDSAFMQPGPMNVAFGVFAGGGDAPQPGPPTRTNIGYGGWSGPTVQVATVDADNQFTDFDEPAAETAIGWHGITLKPVFGSGSWDISGEYTWFTYNQNWQAFNDPNASITSTIYPVMENDTGVGHNYRNAYSPFKERTTQFLVGRAKYSFSNGVEVWGKYKHIDETDDRLNEARFLPFQPGDCPGGGVACTNVRNEYSPGNSTADIYGNPPVITVNGVTGYQWKPFDSITDDDRDLSYNMFQFGVGKQLTADFYSSVQYERYNVDLVDGNTAFQAYNLHEMAGGKHNKNKLIVVGRYILPGLPEAGFQYEYNWGDFEPNFGGGFVTNFADQTTSQNHHVPVGSPGFFGRFGGWNSLATREFTQNRFKGYMKIVF